MMQKKVHKPYTCRKYEAGWHFYGSRYGKNGQDGGYVSLLTEKPS